MIGMIKECWTRETSSLPDEWTPDNSARGQGAVTALVVQDLLGGKLKWGLVDGESHYWNVVDGITIDLTYGQFPLGANFPRETEEKDRETIMSSSTSTAIRYEMLASLVARRLAGRIR